MYHKHIKLHDSQIIKEKERERLVVIPEIERGWKVNLEIHISAEGSVHLIFGIQCRCLPQYKYVDMVCGDSCCELLPSL